MSEKGLNTLHYQGILFGIKSCDLDLCEHCIFGKQKRVQFTTRSSKNFDLLQLIHFFIYLE